MLPCMSTDRVSKGVLKRDDGLLVARGANLWFSVSENQTALSDVRGTLTVFDDPGFARRYSQKRLTFVSAFDPDERMDVFILDANGACIAFPAEAKGQARLSHVR
jgi:hypothetical protein